MNEKYLKLVPIWCNAETLVKNWEVDGNLIKPKNPYNFDKSAVDTFSEMFTNNSFYTVFEKFAINNIFILTNPDGRTIIPDNEIEMRDDKLGTISIVDKPALPKRINIRAAGSFDVSTSSFIQNQVEKLRASGLEVAYIDVYNSLDRVLNNKIDTNDYSKCVNPPAIDGKILDYIIKLSIVV